MKSLMLFVEQVLNDLGTWCHTSTRRDFKTVTLRSNAEGLSFLTITLANFAKDFDKSLSQGYVGHDHFLGFKRKGGLPRFLGGFLDQVFDQSTGRLLDCPNVDAVWAIRQFTLMFAKIELPCSDARVANAFAKYVECEQEVRVHDMLLELDDRKIVEFQRISRLLWTDVFTHVNQDVYEHTLVPRHGPGATADRLRGNAKWDQSVWPHRLDQILPHWKYLASSEVIGQDNLDHVSLLEPEDEIPVRVITVPKTLKSPRIIAVEPTCMQYMQQALQLRIREAIDRDDILSKLVGFRDQGPNQLMARRGSIDGSLATLDLSEASDRVSNLHVELMMANHRWLNSAVQAVRSTKADVPNHGIIPLAKYASMGSALTFPLEAMVFLTVIFLGIERELSRPLTRKDIQSFVGSVRVYGDDIIVPADMVESVSAELESFGFKLNAGKSHSDGNFRESCGRDYFLGHDVSVVRLRSEFPTKRSHTSRLVSTVSTRNQLYRAGMWRSVRYLDHIVEGIIPFPRVAETSPVVGRFSFLGYETQREHPYLHSPLVKGMTVRAPIPESNLDGYPALLKCLSSLTQREEDMPVLDESHLERAGRPQRVDTKLRWARPF